MDSLGLLLSCRVEAADIQDKPAAYALLLGIDWRLPKLKTLWADGGYLSQPLADWLLQTYGWTLQIVKKLQGEFKLLKKRWIVERTFAWLSRNRRMSKDYEWKVQTSETMIELAMIRLMLKRLAL